MKYNQVDAIVDCPDKIQTLIREIKYSDKPLIIRNGLDCKSLQEWYLYLRDVIGLESDRRHFGFDESLVKSDWWEISYQQDKETSYAYSKTRQPLHNDNAWFADPAEMNFFCMVKQAKAGGEQTIYPVNRLVQDLRVDNPDLLHKLQTIVVCIRKGDTELEHNTTILTGNDVPRICWNYYRTDKTDSIIENLCEEFFKYLELKEKTDSVFRVKLNTGDCLAFNDSLLLHGRESFEVDVHKGRIICQSMWNI